MKKMGGGRSRPDAGRQPPSFPGRAAPALRVPQAQQRPRWAATAERRPFPRCGENVGNQPFAARRRVAGNSHPMARACPLKRFVRVQTRAFPADSGPGRMPALRMWRRRRSPCRGRKSWAELPHSPEGLAMAAATDMSRHGPAFLRTGGSEACRRDFLPLPMQVCGRNVRGLQMQD